MKLSKTIIILAIILAVITTGSIYVYIQQIKGEYASANYVEVWVAKETIPPETKIEGGMLELTALPETSLMENVLREERSPVGLYSKETIVRGEQVLSERVSQSDQIKFSYQVPQDKRAVTLDVGEVAGVDHLIEAGDFVDVLVFFAQRQEVVSNNEEESYPDIAKITLQNIEVLSIGQISTEEEESQQGSRKITLALSAADSEKLVYGDEIGSVRLALRHPEDDESTDTEGSIYTDLVPDRRN